LAEDRDGEALAKHLVDTFDKAIGDKIPTPAGGQTPTPAPTPVGGQTPTPAGGQTQMPAGGQTPTAQAVRDKALFWVADNAADENVCYDHARNCLRIWTSPMAIRPTA